MTVSGRATAPHWIALASASLMASVFVPTAQAGRDNPAPIVYRGEPAPEPTKVAPAAKAPERSGSSSAVAGQGKRIEFRYPDQPDRVYGSGGARPADTSAPLAFSSSSAAIAPETARTYAHLDAPYAAQAPVALDPAITSGGFDARATAARIASQSAPPQDESTLVPEIKPPQPLQIDPASFSTRGETIRPAPVEQYQEAGRAGVYGDEFQGQPTANGETFDQSELMAAHPSLPLPSLVQVISADTGREVVVRVNDRGPFVDGRLIDISRKAADLLGIAPGREAQVRLRYLGPAPVTGQGPARAVAAEAPARETLFEGSRAPLDVSAPSPTMPKPTREGHYFVQLGSFADIANAERLTSSLGARTPVEIIHARVHGADFFRVWVGPYGSRDEAGRMRDDFSRRGVANGMVVSQN